MSEKFDGIRGFWNGKQLLTRGGQQIITPDWFIENYPPFSIDGELWTKRVAPSLVLHNNEPIFPAYFPFPGKIFSITHSVSRYFFIT
jgi:hypothetical protein